MLWANKECKRVLQILDLCILKSYFKYNQKRIWMSLSLLLAVQKNKYLFKTNTSID